MDPRACHLSVSQAGVVAPRCVRCLVAATRCLIHGTWNSCDGIIAFLFSTFYVVEAKGATQLFSQFHTCYGFRFLTTDVSGFAPR